MLKKFEDTSTILLFKEGNFDCHIEKTFCISLEGVIACNYKISVITFVIDALTRTLMKIGEEFKHIPFCDDDMLPALVVSLLVFSEEVDIETSSVRPMSDLIFFNREMKFFS